MAQTRKPSPSLPPVPPTSDEAAVEVTHGPPRLPSPPPAPDDAQTAHDISVLRTLGAGLLHSTDVEEITVEQHEPLAWNMPVGGAVGDDESSLVRVVQPRLLANLPPARDTEYLRKQALFNGAWQPFDDPLLIGENNYADLQNFRYKDRSLITVLGYTRINTAAHATYVSGRSGIHFIKSILTVPTSYVLAQVENAGLTASAVLQHTTSIPSQGNFSATPLLVDGTSAGLGRFSLAPDGNVVYANGVQAMIWGSPEHRCAAFILQGVTGEYYQDYTQQVTNVLFDSENIARLFINSTTLSRILIGSTRPLQGIKFYMATANTAVAAPGALTAAFNVAAGNLNGAYTWRVTFVNASGETAGGTVSNSISPVNQQADLTAIPIGPSGTTSRRLYRPIGGGGSYLLVTTIADNTTTTYTDNIADGALGAAMPTTSTADATATIAYWGYTAGWTTVAGFVDGTVIGGTTLAQTGTMTFTSTDIADARVRLDGERVLYFYRVTFSGPLSSTTSVYHCTVDAPFQTVKDIWDGVYRTPISFQRLQGGTPADYTLEVNEESPASAGIVAVLNALPAGPGGDNFVEVCFTETLMGFYWKMLAEQVNQNPAITTLESWNGIAYAAVVGLEDNTSVSGKPLGRTGTMIWRYSLQNISDVARTLYGVTGHWYRISWSAALSATVGVDALYGIPRPRVDLTRARFPFFYQNRLFLMGIISEGQNEAAEFSFPGAPDVWNGRDTSAAGQRLYFGTGGDLLAATELFNRFAGNLQYLAVVCKATETFVLTGNDPTSFSIMPISRTIGCPAPLTIDSAEVNFSIAEDAQRHVAMWLSWQGPVLFDGGVIVPIKGIEPYFDPSDTRYVNINAIENARGWFDPLSLSPEYNLLLPSGGGQATNNVWLVYNVKQQKWTRKVPVEYPQMGFRVRDSQGRMHLYGWRDSVGLMMRLENGFTWDGTAITARVDTADLLPTQSVWDITRLRRLKLLTRRTTAAINAVIIHFANGATGGTTLETFALESGAARYRRMTGTHNDEAYSHQLRFTVVTSTEQVELLGWGSLMEVVREDLS